MAEKIPNFFVVGVVKGGTTSLYHYLEQHPEVYLPQVKETNHFAAADINHQHFLPEYALDVRIDLDKYIAGGMREKVHIAHVDRPEQYHALFTAANGQKAIGEISNSYMICPSAAKAIYDYNPDAKIVAILRNPISRAWSQYLMNLRESKTLEPNFLAEVQMDASREHKGWGVSHQYLELGMYASQLRNYLKYFPRQQIKLLFFEVYRSNPAQVMQELCAFLGIDGSFRFDFSEKSNTASMPRHKALNRLLVSSGVVRKAKDMVPKKMRSALSSVLYTESGIPEIAIEEVTWLKEYYAEEVDALKAFTETNPETFWKEFKK